MKKILICYFSGTGNTKRIAELYRSTLEDNGSKVELVPLVPNQPIYTDISDFDLIGIGYPIHAFNAPKVILDFCRALPKGDKRVFLFKTSGEPVHMNDISSLKTIKLLRKRGYAVTNEYHYVMPYNIIFRHSDEMAYNMWQAATELVPLDVKELLSGKPHKPKKVFAGDMLACAMRVEHWGAHLNGKFYRVNGSCTHCNLCVKTCPADNIRIDKDGKIVFGSSCIMCMRCAFNCPKNAIDIGLFKRWKVNGKYTFAPPTSAEIDRHNRYCAKAYKRYFADAEARIAENTSQNI